MNWHQSDLPPQDNPVTCCGMNGIINLDKPAGISSAAAVGRVKRILPRGTKIGHAGTLDPFATGVLLLLVGRATKLCEMLMDQPKQYQTIVELGSTTQTDDPESPKIPWAIPPTQFIPPTATEIKIILSRYVGQILQQPPAYSAIKVNGRRAYQLARQGAPPVLPPRPVIVYGIETMDYTWPHLQLHIDCGRGTYIRSLARDIGASLNVGGHLTQLRRTRIGSFQVDAARSLTELSEANIADVLTPMDAVH